METANVFDRAQYSSSKHVKMILQELDDYKVLVIGLEPEQEIPPCIMGSQTIFYVVHGSGTLSVGQEKNRLVPGSIAFIPPGSERSVLCVDKMLILAVQVH